MHSEFADFIDIEAAIVLKKGILQKSISVATTGTN
jgi:hypothetical protein